MQSGRARSPRAAQPIIVTPGDLALVRVVAELHAANAKQVSYALGRQGSMTTIRARLSRLAGGADFQARAALVRYPLPSANGNPVRVFSPGAGSRAILREDLGLRLPAASYRPSRQKVIGVSFLRHSLLCASSVVALRMFIRRHPEMELQECTLELARRPGLKVIPDVWIRMGNREGEHAIFFEVDASTTYRVAWVNRCAARLRWVRSGGYTALGVPGVLIVYLIAGYTAEAANDRLHAVAQWIVETIKALGLKASWAGSFRLASVGSIDEVYEQEQGIFERPIWRMPDQPDTPLPLLGP
jgi:hypothetical protein